ncbi:MAG TPA: zinc ribbon domain-containing protein [Burkholderiales bacterium]|nr:zinc ribbon domain-containing protein [Burkholderiales bacterium]
MPIYEYRCSSCGFQKEYLQKINDPVMSVCPECSKSTFSKMLSAAGFKLKGSGWYATDFKNSGSKPAAKTSVETGDKGAAKSETKDPGPSKSESKDAGPSKPDGKSESKSEAAA